MTGLDWVIVAALILFAWNGYRIGFVHQLIQVMSLAASFYVARTYAPVLAPYLSSHISALHSVSPMQPAMPGGVSGYDNPFTQGIQNSAMASIGYAVAFAVLFFLTHMAFRVFGSVLGGIASLPILSFVNRVAGGFIGLVLTVLIGSVALHLALMLPLPNLHLAIQHSSLAKSLLAIHLWPNGQINPTPDPVF